MALKIVNEENYADFTGSLASYNKQYYSGLGYPNVDAWYGPYSSKEVAHKMMTRHFEKYDEGTLDEAPDTSTNIPQGQTVGVLELGAIVEYQYKKTCPDDGYTIDDLELKNSKGIGLYYAECNCPRESENKEVVGVQEFPIVKHYPTTGTHLVVRFLLGHHATYLTMKVNAGWASEVKVGDYNMMDIDKNGVLDLVYDADNNLWRVVSAEGVNLPTIVLSNHMLKTIMAGDGNAKLLWNDLSGIAGHRIMILFDTNSNYVSLDIKEKTDTSITLTAIHAGLFYEFEVTSSAINILENGLEVVTVWE